jgi:hypothetical protein
MKFFPFLFICVGSVLNAQAKLPPADSILTGITERGRALSEYDFAAWHGSDAIASLRPPAGSVTHYIARRTDSGWTVTFGHLSASRDTFLVAYEAVPSATPSQPARYSATAAPRSDTGYYRRAAMAIDVAQADFGSVARPYNVAALPGPDGRWWVYLVPAPTVPGVWPLGGDARYLISADGREIIARRQLHKSILEFDARKFTEGSNRLKAGTHTAVLDNIPEDTDVFYVLERSPKMPEYIVTDAFIFRIDVDGVIRNMGRREDILGK